MCLCGGWGLFNTLEEFYADGQPMCAHRQLVAGTENGNLTTADTQKALATILK